VATSTAIPTDTPQPTATPTPEEIGKALPAQQNVTSTPSVLTPSPTRKPTATLVLVAVNLATYPAASRVTPPAARQAASERPLFDFAGAPGLNTFAIVIGLQAVVLVVVGVIVVNRVRRRS
jgi:hypothetical protein